MALLSAFVLEGVPFVVWIAQRTDGIAGTGTIAGLGLSAPRSPDFQSISICRFGRRPRRFFGRGSGKRGVEAA